MNSGMKRLSIVLGVLFCLLIVGFFMNAGRDDAGGDRRSAVRKDVPKLPAVDQNRVAAIELSDSGSTIRLEKAGDEWVLPASGRAPAVKTRVEELVRTFSAFERGTHVAYSASDPSRYGFDPQQYRRLKLFDERGGALVDVLVGKEDESGGAAVGQKGTFVRAGEGSDVYTIPAGLAKAVRTNQGWWMEKQLFPADPKSKNALVGTAERVTLEFADLPPPSPAATQPADSRPAPDPADAPRFRVVLEAKQEEVPVAEATPGPVRPGAPTPDTRKTETKRVWRMIEPEGEVAEVFAPAVEGVVRTVLFATCVDVAGADSTVGGFGLETPSASAEVAFADGSVRKITVGSRAAPPDDPAIRMQPARYATASGSTRVFRIGDHTAQAFRRKPADFKPPEMPKPIDASPPPISVPEEGGDTRPVK
jgi:hypothetical protein